MINNQIISNNALPRSLSQEFIRLKPSMILRMLFELPDIATSGKFI